MKNIKSIILGVATLVLALGLNFRHVLDDYGILNNKLHVAVLAQTNGSGSGTGGSSSGGGTSGGGSGGSSTGSNENGGNPFYYKTRGSEGPDNCTIEVSGYFNAQGEISSVPKIGFSWSKKSVKGYTEPCKANSGPGCTIFSCTTTNGGSTT